MEEIKKVDAEVVDLLAREGLKMLQRASFETKSKQDALAVKHEELLLAHTELKERMIYFNVGKMQSDQLDKLFSALSKAKAAIAKEGDAEASGTGQRDGNDKGFPKVDDMRKFIDPIIEKFGLSYQMEPITIDDRDFLKFTLCHESGQYKSSISRVDSQPSISLKGWQAYGESLTYLKRFVLGAIFSFDTGSRYLDDEEPKKEEPKKLFQQPAINPIKKPMPF